MDPGVTKVLNAGDKEIVSVKMEEDNASDLARKREIIYDRGADATFEFENGELIHINKTLLAFESQYFYDIFFGLSPGTRLQIRDFSRETFQSFLDCLFDLKNYSVSDALAIFPIAHEYRVKKCLRKCISALQPTEMNKNVCLALSLAIFYECQGLVDDIINFIKNEVGILSVIENKNYCRILEPKTMSKLIEHIEFDSYVWKMLYEWRKVSGSPLKNIHSIFLTNVSLSHFESVKSIFDFHKMTSKRLLNSDEILDFLEKNLRRRNGEKLPENSGWVLVKKGEKITETIVFKNSLVVSPEDSTNGLSLNIWRNRVHPKVLKGIDSTIKCEVRCNFGVIFQNFSRKGGGVGENKKAVFSAPVPTSGPPFPTFSCAAATPPGNDPSCSDEDVSGDSSRLLYGVPNFNVASPFHGVHEIEEKISYPNPKKLSFPINLPHQFSEVKSVEITYTFSFDCRILKTSISDNIVDADKLYFTKDVVYS